MAIITDVSNTANRGFGMVCMRNASVLWEFRINTTCTVCDTVSNAAFFYILLGDI